MKKPNSTIVTKEPNLPKRAAQTTQLTTIETALQAQFKPDANIVRKKFDEVEFNRAAFAISAMKFGLAALAAKATVSHGKFGDWLKSTLADNGNIRVIAYNTAREYLGWAKVFLRKLGEPTKLTGALDSGVENFCGIYNIKERSKFNIETILASGIMTDELLKSTVGGMNLTQMRQLMREGAEQAYDDAKEEEAQKLTKRDLRGLQSDKSEDNGQLTFYNELFTEIRAVTEVKRENDPRFLALSKDEKTELGNYLIQQGKAIVAIANEQKD